MTYMNHMIEEAYDIAVKIEEGNTELLPVHDLMERNGDRQSDMTDVAPRTAINEICNGKRKLNRNHIERLCKKYSLTADYFLG